MLVSRKWVSLLALAASAVAGACTERLDAGATCPALCPDQNVSVRDTVIDAVALDTTLAGYPSFGSSPYLFLATRGDTLDARAVIRFDRLRTRYLPQGAADSVAIARVDSAQLRLRVDLAGAKIPGSITFEAYDVDTTAADTAFGALVPLFRAGRLLGSASFTQAQLTDSVRIPLSGAALLAKIQANGRLRIGLRAVGPGATQIRVISTFGGLGSLGPTLRFRPTGDTTAAAVVLGPSSTTPSAADSPVDLSPLFVDYTILARGNLPVTGSDLVVGGATGQRAYLRFAIPARLVDSTTIVRATLLLTQRPSTGIDARDTITILPIVGAASAAVTDLARAAAIGLDARIYGLDSLRVVPADSGERALPMVSVVRVWRALPRDLPRALILSSGREGASAASVRFFSAEAPAGVRPRLRISFIPQVEFGLP